ncbi:MAG: PD-(D/E)XK nuclease family protein [Nitriliruptoraceae bacterium]
MSRLDLATAAQQRLAEELLGWGQPRPAVDRTFVASLRQHLEAEIGELQPHVGEVASSAPRGRVLITKSRLDRLACDGYALDAAPFTFSRASMRGILTHAAIERDWRGGRSQAADALVAAVWQDEASRRPGDPSSASAWMNAQPGDEAEALRAEIADLVASFREVWPNLHGAPVEASVERAFDVTLGGGTVALFGRPDIVLSSHRDDGRARTLVVDLKTGQPRPEHDRHELRFYALLVTLATGVPPFRWATYYVTEGRYDTEDLRTETLEVTARRIVDGVRQQLRITPRPADDEGLVIRGGSWCRWCLRVDDCAEAARVRAEWMSQAPGMMGP